MSKPHYILNKVDNAAVLLIDGEISEWWGVGLSQVSNELANLNADSITVQINSVGGSVTEGQAIASFLRGYPANVTTNGIGLVASIATIILLAGKKTSMSKGSWFMIHRPWAGVQGESEDMRHTADLLDQIDSEIANIYVDAIELNNKLINASREDTKKKVQQWMKNETWFTADQAFDIGFISSVTDGASFYNKANALEMYNSCKSFKNAPAEFLNQIKNVVDMAEPTPQVEEKASFLDMFKALFTSNKAEVKELINSISNENEAEKLAEIENAKRIAKENGFFKEDVTEVIENKEVTEEPSEEAKQIAQMTAQIEEANAKIQALEESKLSPSAGDGGKASENAKAQANLIAPTKAHEDIINSLPNIFKR
jgi:ATP-dependent Clp protease, protease subunit